MIAATNEDVNNDDEFISRPDSRLTHIATDSDDVDVATGHRDWLALEYGTFAVLAHCCDEVSLLRYPPQRWSVSVHGDRVA